MVQQNITGLHISVAGAVVSEVSEHFRNGREHPADFLLGDFLLAFAVLLNDIFESSADVAVLDKYLSLAVVRAGEGRGRVRPREGVARREEVGVRQFASWFERGGEPANTLLLEDEVLVDRSYLFVEQHLSAVS